MESDDVLQAWASFEARLKRTERLNDLIVVESLARRAQTPLMRERRQLTVEVVVNLLAVIALGSFAFDHAGTAAGNCAAILVVALIAINAVLVGIAAELARIDFDGPVLAMQAQLARVKTRRAALTAVTLALSPLLWAPIVVIVPALFGADPVKTLGVPYILGNAAFGLLLAAAAWLAARLLARSRRAQSWRSGAIDVLSGSAYREAADYLDTIERYSED